MTEKRYMITLGKNNEFKEIIDHCKGDKQITVLDFLKQVNEQDKALKELKKENKEIKKQLEREETDKKRLMSYLMRYKGFGFDEIVDDYFNNPYYDNWWEDGFYESCWDDYLKEKSFDGCDEE